MAKKKKHGADESENIQLRPNEKILKTARPGRAAELYFIVPALVFFGIGIALSMTSAWAYISSYIPAGTTMVTVMALLFVLGFLMLFLRFVVMGRFYLITNERVIVTKGRARKTQMFLNLEDIHGAFINQSMLYRVFRLAVIEFFSPSSQPRSKSFLIFSYSSTAFQFTFLNKTDGEECYSLLQTLLNVRRELPKI